MAFSAGAADPIGDTLSAVVTTRFLLACCNRLPQDQSGAPDQHLRPPAVLVGRVESNVWLEHVPPQASSWPGHASTVELAWPDE